jgi:hypothetical protein
LPGCWRCIILLHWLTVFLVLTQFGSAHVWDLLEKGTPWRIGLITTHLAFGIVLARAVLIRSSGNSVERTGWPRPSKVFSIWPRRRSQAAILSAGGAGGVWISVQPVRGQATAVLQPVLHTGFTRDRSFPSTYAGETA